MVNRSGVMVVALAAGLAWHAPAMAQNAGPGWVTAWATSQQGLGPAKITNATVRLIARVTIPGDSVRIRLDNTFGTAPVTFDKASIGVRVRGAAVAEGPIKPLTRSIWESLAITGAPTCSRSAACRKHRTCTTRREASTRR